MPVRRLGFVVPLMPSFGWRLLFVTGSASGVALAFAVAADFGLAGYLAATATFAATFPFVCRIARPLPDIAAVTAGTIGCWVALPGTAITLAADAKCGGVLLAVLALQAGILCLCSGMKLNRDLATAFCCVVTLSWLSWPLWLESAPPLLIRCHPLLAINGVLASPLGVWTEQPVAYRIMSLGQDVAYTLPDAVWPAIISHGGLGVLAWSLGRSLIDRRGRWSGQG